MVIEKREKEKIPGEKFAGKLEECAKRLVIKERDGYKKEGERKNPCRKIRQWHFNENVVLFPGN